MTTKVNWGGQNYVSPSLDVIDVKAEGVLCASGEGNIEDATLEDWGTL